MDPYYQEALPRLVKSFLTSMPSEEMMPEFLDSLSEIASKETLQHINKKISELRHQLDQPHVPQKVEPAFLAIPSLLALGNIVMQKIDTKRNMNAGETLIAEVRHENYPLSRQDIATLSLQCAPGATVQYQDALWEHAWRIKPPYQSCSPLEAAEPYQRKETQFKNNKNKHLALVADSYGKMIATLYQRDPKNPKEDLELQLDIIANITRLFFNPELKQLLAKKFNPFNADYASGLATRAASAFWGFYFAKDMQELQKLTERHTNLAIEIGEALNYIEFNEDLKPRGTVCEELYLTKHMHKDSRRNRSGGIPYMYLSENALAKDAAVIRYVTHSGPDSLEVECCTLAKDQTTRDRLAIHHATNRLQIAIKLAEDRKQRDDLLNTSPVVRVHSASSASTVANLPSPEKSSAARPQR